MERSVDLRLLRICMKWTVCLEIYLQISLGSATERHFENAFCQNEKKVLITADRDIYCPCSGTYKLHIYIFIIFYYPIFFLFSIFLSFETKYKKKYMLVFLKWINSLQPIIIKFKKKRVHATSSFLTMLSSLQIHVRTLLNAFSFFIFFFLYSHSFTRPLQYKIFTPS